MIQLDQWLYSSLELWVIQITDLDSVHIVGLHQEDHDEVSALFDQAAEHLPGDRVHPMGVVDDEDEWMLVIGEWLV